MMNYRLSLKKDDIQDGSLKRAINIQQNTESNGFVGFFLFFLWAMLRIISNPSKVIGSRFNQQSVGKQGMLCCRDNRRFLNLECGDHRLHMALPSKGII